MQELQDSYSSDEHCRDIIALILLDPTSQPKYEWNNDLLKYDGRIYVGSSSGLRDKIIQALHSSALGGHSGQRGCWQRIKSLFYWPTMKQNVIQFIQSCDTCQRYKAEHVHAPGLLQPLPVPRMAWTHLTMDFIESLPNSQRYDTIQSDGQTERLNQCVEAYLRCMTGEFPKLWSKWLAMAEWWYNSSFHSSLQLTPFEALYGYKPVSLPLGPYLDTIVPAAAQLLQERIRISSSIRDHLAKAQQRMKFFANQHRTERSFEVGAWAFLKLQPYRQQTISIRKCLKLAARFYGPFQVEAKVGPVAYRLKLPAEARIHPVFHVSLPKKKIGLVQQVSKTLPEFDNDDQCPLQPEAMLQRRVILRNGQPAIQLLIKWCQLGVEEASWEDKDFILSQFPHFQS
ncbi:uncharacterized protein LOC113755200 [Coffea eugenioides]|uniref:uncharacterized protein LOC113755200 n=1 Tax=Coffea eugenioides TaxID=49369 RepID=UPI000F60CF6B|nr:uncharacterized protein LOC113755200 [Coffea eugenioides]